MSKIILPDGVKAVSGDDDVRKAEAMAKVKAIMDEYDAQLVPWMHMEGGQIQQGISIALKPRLTPEQEAAMKLAMEKGSKDGLPR